MHPNPTFRGEATDRNIAFARQRGFGTLAVNTPDGAPLLSHVPFVLSEVGKLLEAHLVRSNPILRLTDEPVEAVVAVLGPDAYISPDWYGMEDQVPTWNYVAVHLRGKLQRLPDDRLHDILERTSGHFESMLAPKPVWTTAKMDQKKYARMLRQIVPVTMQVETVDGTWKLSQNKPDSARLGAAEALATSQAGAEIAAMRGLMLAAKGE
jgi:transcriptional regulator